ncbi:MAG: protein TolR [Desulfarculales bacterium]|jgi:biopolymer transport protein TolR|nr:protein TolR [Desulfarculales bacterium]
MAAGRHGKLMGEINVVPLVDVVLVLLIIFMVTAPMLTQGLDVALPETNSSALKQADEVLVLTVTRGGQLYLDEFPVERDGLAAKIRNITERRPDTKIYLRADKDIPYGVIVQIMAQTREAGIKDLGMVTEPESIIKPEQP